MILCVGLALARPASNGFVDSPTHDVRCHYQREVDEPRCADVLAHAELAWDTQVLALEFRRPPPDSGLGGSDALDIYLGVSETSEAGEAWVDCDGGDGTCIDTDPNDGYAAASSYVVIDARTSDDVLGPYVVHEFAHTLQYATDYAEPFLSVWEGTAVAAEMWTLPEVDPSVSDIADYQAVPWLSAVLQDGYYLADHHDIPDSWYEYGAVCWVRWMDDRYGDGAGSGAVMLWEAMTQEGQGDEPDVLDAWSELEGASWREPFLDFVVARARMGGPEGPAWLAFAGVQARAWREVEDGDVGTWTPAYPLFPLGMAFYDIAGVEDEPLAITLEGAEETEWALVVVDGDEAVRSTSHLEITPDAGRITVAAVNLGAAEMDADDELVASTFTLTVERRAAHDPDGLDPKPSCTCGARNVPNALALFGLTWAFGRRYPKRRSSPKRTPPSMIR